MRTRSMRFRDDRGAVLLIFAVFTLVAVIFLAVVVDLGGLRQEKKEVTLSTDAAALAGVSLANMSDPDLATIHDLTPCVEVGVDPVLSATGKNPQAFTDVQQVVTDYLTRNGQSTGVDCQVARSGTNQGYVVVSANEVVEYAFGNAVGQTSGQVGGMSVAARASGLGGGLRPVALCSTEESLNEKSAGAGYSIGSDVLSQGTLDARGVRVLTSPITVVLEKEHLKKNPDACNTGDAAGQRGQVNFDAKNGNGGQKCDDPPQAPDADQSYVESFRDGYHGQINDYVEQDAGNDFNTATPCMDDLIASSQRVWLPVYDSYDKSKKSYRVVAFIEAEFEGYCLQNGSAENDPGDTTACKLDDSEWFRIKIHGSFTPTSFPTAPPLTSDAQASQAFICAYDDGSTTLQNQCTAAVGVISGPPPAPQPQPSCNVTQVNATSPSPFTAGREGPGSKAVNKNVSLTIVVSAEAPCAGLDGLFRDRNQTNRTNDLNVTLTGPNTYTATVAKGTGDYKGSGSGPWNWDLELDANGTPVTYPGSPITLVVS